MGKFGLITKDEDRAIELLFGQSKGMTESSRILAKEGITMTPAQLKGVRDKQYTLMVDEMRDEAKSSFLLKSVNKVILNFEDVYSTYDRLAKRFEAKGEDFQLIVALREQSKMLDTSLKVLGQLSNGIQSQINAKNVNIITSTDVMAALEKSQNRMFAEMEPELKDGKLTFNNPSPEFLDNYYRWKFRSGKAVNETK